LADIVVTSLTKYFSGYGDVLAGCVTLNPRSQYAGVLRTALENDFEELLIDADAEVLEKNSRDLRERVTTINRNAAIIARRLFDHPMVQNVYYPGLSEDAASEEASSGFGGLLSIVLKAPAITTPIMFDHLEVCKGPNLGTNFTLCCPYTILAHYTDLEFVEDCGVSRWLLRISIGVEATEDLWQRIERALAAAASGMPTPLRPH
jgi:cystathionine gamma-synthase